MDKMDAKENSQRATDPSPLPIHMCGPDVLGQVGTAGKLQLTVVPAAGVAKRLPTGSRRATPHWHAAAVTVEQGRCGATAGRRALHVHQRAADAAEVQNTRVKRCNTAAEFMLEFKYGIIAITHRARL